MTGDTRTVSREVTVQVEAVADNLRSTYLNLLKGYEAASPVSITFDEFSVEKTDVGENAGYYSGS